MIEYIVFFGMLAAGIVAFIFYRPPETQLTPVVIERTKCESPIERRLFDALTANGYVVTTQIQCGRYRIDLALKNHNIAIECDGKEFHSKPEDKKRDRRKDAYLRKNGWKVMRFSGRQINNEINKVLNKIINVTNNKTPE